MIYSVDFSIKINDRFSTIHTAFVYALSVSECRKSVKEIKNKLAASQKHDIHIFIEETLAC
ncbi:hypothetical protein [Cytobacillus praedii]|uniref:Uncharacterized protein n=1 Tax=Cytobacillus praedii TaxID=1742358 RepID=A0A4R1AYM1_9BACI|nr:hypothetical protein [Cytobacillus praedii]TCJ05068.1 hypothetical protein E0Y62_07585 [Cytobacillus praedii]